MAEADFDIKGLFGVKDLTGLIRNIYAADAIAVEAITRETRDSLERAFKIAQDLCPVDTRFMKDHMHGELTDDELFWEIFYDPGDFFEAGLPFYPPYVEYPTSRTKAQPHLTPAYEQEHPVYLRRIGSQVSAALERRKVR